MSEQNKTTLLHVISTSIDIMSKHEDRVFWFGVPPDLPSGMTAISVGEGTEPTDKSKTRIIAAMKDDSSDVVVNYGQPDNDADMDEHITFKKGEFNVETFLELIKKVYG